MRYETEGGARFKFGQGAFMDVVPLDDFPEGGRAVFYSDFSYCVLIQKESTYQVLFFPDKEYYDEWKEKNKNHWYFSNWTMIKEWGKQFITQEADDEKRD